MELMEQLEEEHLGYIEVEPGDLIGSVEELDELLIRH
jgi:hypothetical protein